MKRKEKYIFENFKVGDLVRDRWNKESLGIVLKVYNLDECEVLVYWVMNWDGDLNLTRKTMWYDISDQNFAMGCQEIYKVSK
ncbi:MAG: hypothetical protein Q8P81_03605 [Nanoarchaeota archaeon]|nr:hypothetical protein [Nanoarchaeota archaeon]